jgi:hypothetical protein
VKIDAVKRVKASKPFTVLDAVILAALIAAAGLGAFFIYRIPPAAVSVKADGHVRTYPLDEDREIALGHLTVRIVDGAVWVEHADCADRTCERTGKITRAGQSIVCLPNGIVVKIVGKSDLSWEIGR